MNAPYWENAEAGIQLYLGDSLDVLPTLADASVDAVVCDPPYALAELPAKLVIEALAAWLTGDRAHIPSIGRGFMGRNWDRFVPPPAVWDECLRVLKPGGHLLAFAGARTVDLMGLSMRLAGFEIRDSIDWIYGSGMPKGKQQLKPAHEPIVLARKPLDGTLTATMARHGTGRLGIDGCRINAASRPLRVPNRRNGNEVYGNRLHGSAASGTTDTGRWPTNIILSHPPLLDEHGQPFGDACADGCVPDCPIADMDTQSGVNLSRGGSRGQGGGRGAYSVIGAQPDVQPGYGDIGGASRFFPTFRYEPKAPTSQRPRLADGTAWPTVKPLALMRWLVRLVTPPEGTVLDWCAGTGTTLEAARLEGVPAIGVERDQVAAELSRIRLDKPYMAGLFDPA